MLNYSLLDYFVLRLVLASKRGQKRAGFCYQYTISCVISAAERIDTLTARGPHVNCSTEKHERGDDHRRALQCAEHFQVAE